MADAGHLLPFLSQFESSSTAAQRLVILAPAFVSAQSLFDAGRGLVGAFIGVSRHSLGFEQSAGIEMKYAFSTKSEAFFTDRGMSGIGAAKIFRRRFVDPVCYSLPQRHTNADVPSRNAQRHLSASISRSV